MKFKFILFFLLSFLFFRPSYADTISEYYLVHSGTRHLSEARVVLIGQQHNYRSDYAMEAEVLRVYANPKEPSKILLEGASSESLNKVISAYAGYPILPIHAQGWDNLGVLEETKAAFRQRCENAQVLDSDTASFLDGISASANNVFRDAELKRLLRVRNTSMMDNIRVSLMTAPDQKLFVVAGQLHLLGDSRLIGFLKSLRVPYSIIVPNMNNSNRKPTISAAEYGKKLTGVECPRG